MTERNGECEVRNARSDNYSSKWIQGREVNEARNVKAICSSETSVEFHRVMSQKLEIFKLYFPRGYPFEADSFATDMM
jgi:hypothetical protein